MPDLRDISARALPDILSAFALLTRLPLPDHLATGAASAWAWPLVGAVLGAMAALVGSVGLWLGLTAGVTAVLILAFGALVTGGLHEDGLSDSADGLFGGWTRERRLEIMKDSRVGSYGVLALVLVTLARWSALATVLDHGSLWGLVAVGALSRLPMAVIMATLPNARGAGLSHATGRPSGEVTLIGAALAVAIACLFAGWAALPMLLGAGLTTALLARSAQARIGGQTGDILGAAQQLAEAACLAVLAARLS
ncbi:MAG: adenosylcobinamide-GDP ribazoletransferase [Rhodobacterales bacterium 12-65-15]|nr:MAG: adenosylcobinamide-GDP ribazoletransferase [Rhodobacterales bacterium 12-65-15]